MKHNSKLTPYAQDLRNNMTIAERKLWYEYLSKYPSRFRRQVTVGNYIMDFYCASARLAIELDGSQHYSDEGKESDTARTRFLESQGIKVLRYSNLDILENLNGVCIDIDREVNKRV